MDIIEQNKKLAKFLSYNVTEFQCKDWKTLAFCDEDDYVDFRHVNYFEPHKNWSQIMELIELIEGLGCIVEISFSLVVGCRICWIGKKHEKAINFNNDNQNEGFQGESILGVYKSVVEFINWYELNAA